MAGGTFRRARHRHLWRRVEVFPLRLGLRADAPASRLHLPIELWHLGPHEVTPAMRALLAPFGVRCVDGLEVRERHPVRTLHGWEMKCYALLHCAFAEVLLLDADNVPVVNPAFLFHEPEYHRTGAVFWPDFGRLGPERSIWPITGIPYRDEPEFESGPLLGRAPARHALQ